jgi:hypothetical protein
MNMSYQSAYKRKTACRGPLPSFENKERMDILR